MTKILICGAGGFIGGHLASKFIEDKDIELVCVDIKPQEYWFQKFDNAKNFTLDLKSFDNSLKVTEGVDYIYNFACNMGGMGFIENNKAECMLSVLVNTNMLRASVKNNCKKYYFSSSACVYNGSKQKDTFINGLKEEDAYPADPEDGYGWEKLFSERMCRHFYEDFGLETRVARYHNIYGPQGTFDGGREKAPAALCRKIINIGSEEQVSINQMIEIIEEIANYKVSRNYQLDKPKGVRGRSSDNTLVEKKLGWKPKLTLKQGLEKTYQWIENKIQSGTDIEKFCKSSIEN